MAFVRMDFVAAFADIAAYVPFDVQNFHACPMHYVGGVLVADTQIATDKEDIAYLYYKSRFYFQKLT
ncbi:MAG: hypothetical protein FWE44_04210 [Defluviitaleaceae bacterium]|nr:hypothetical protein [Defluviitaleaceae bacterium]